MKLRAFVPIATYPDAATEPSLRDVVEAAGLIGAELHALALVAHIPQVSSALSRVLINVPEMIEGAEKLSARNGAKLLADAKRLAEAASVAIATDIAKGQLALLGDLAASHARYLEMSLIGLVPGNQTIRMLAEAVLFGSGRPTLLVPEGKSLKQLDHIAIAWDGSRVAARALADSRFLLERASKITVITVTDEKPLKEADAGERLAKSLANAGLKANFSATLAEDCPIAETLQAHAGEVGADVLVMGAYGHSRLRDFVLGGATEGVLSELTIPVLLSH